MEQICSGVCYFLCWCLLEGSSLPAGAIADAFLLPQCALWCKKRIDCAITMVVSRMIALIRVWFVKSDNFWIIEWVSWIRLPVPYSQQWILGTMQPKHLRLLCAFLWLEVPGTSWTKAVGYVPIHTAFYLVCCCFASSGLSNIAHLYLTVCFFQSLSCLHE